MEPIPRKPASEDPPLLLAKSLIKRFGGVAAVDDVTIHVGRSEIVGLIGPNGAGKTTLFDLIAGELKPTSGGIWLDGAAVELPRRIRGWRMASDAPFRSHARFPA